MESLSSINSNEDVLRYFREVYTSRGHDYFYTEYHDNLQPFELGPYSRDVNAIMNCFEEVRAQNIELKYCWFYINKNDELAFFSSDEPLYFETVRASLTSPGRYNDVMIGLDLSKTFDDQLFDFDLSNMTFDDLAENPIDMVNTKGVFKMNPNAPPPDQKVAFLNNPRLE